MDSFENIKNEILVKKTAALQQCLNNLSIIPLKTFRYSKGSKQFDFVLQCI